MWKVTHVYAALLLLLHVSSHVSGYDDEYSDSTWPFMVLRVANLEMAREQLVYGGTVIPRRKGLIELECSIARSSLEPSLGKQLANEVDGIEWDLPNQKIIREKRAFIKDSGSLAQPGMLQSSLVIKDFRPSEDAGAYSCRPKFKHQRITRYQEQIYIPSLDGAPILQCEFECKRNTDEACQLMEEYALICYYYSLTSTLMECVFQECQTEDRCPDMVIGDPRSKDIAEFVLPTMTMYNHDSRRLASGLAVQSGAYDCEARNGEGVATLRYYMPVTVNKLKEPGVFPDTSLPVAPPKPQVAYGSFWDLKTEWYGTDVVIYEFGCWTSRDVGQIRWNFRSIENREAAQTLTEKTLPTMNINTYSVAGGRASVLKIRDTREDHGGFYFCEAADGHNRAVLHKQFEVDSGVWKDDANVHTESTITRQAGSSVTLKCTMRTTGDHDVSWERVNQEEGEYESIYGGQYAGDNIEMSGNQEILTIHNLTDSNSGVYKCTCTFNVHKLEAKVTLNVVDHQVDQHEQVEHLHHAMNTLRAAEAQIRSFVLAMTQHIEATKDYDSTED